MTMRLKIMIALLIVSIGVNLWMAWDIRKSRQEQADLLKNQIASAAASAEAADAVQSDADASLEMNFLRELITRALTFQSKTYSTSRQNLALLLSPSLVEARKTETERLAERMKDHSVSQDVTIERIEQLDETHFQAESTLRLKDGKKTLSLESIQKIEVEKEPATKENPWGFRAKAFENRMVDKTPVPLQTLALKVGKRALLIFPCAVHDVSKLDPQLLKFETVTSRRTELHLRPLRPWKDAQPLQVSCGKKTFSFQLKTDTTPVLRYYLASETEGHRLTGKARARRDEVKRSLERQLGFEIEESDK